MKGKKTGGRRRGTPNKATKQRAQLLAHAVLAATLDENELAEITPLAALLRILRAEMKVGDHAAAKVTASYAAPYMHARLSSSDVTVKGSLTTKSELDLRAEIALLLAHPDNAAMLLGTPEFTALLAPPVKN